MNINNKEFSEIFPLNPPQNGYSFRNGFPIVQFQIANQAKLLDGRSLGRVCCSQPMTSIRTSHLTQELPAWLGKTARIGKPCRTGKGSPSHS